MRADGPRFTPTTRVRIVGSVAILAVFVCAGIVWRGSREDPSAEPVDLSRFVANGIATTQAQYDLSRIVPEPPEPSDQAWARAYVTLYGSAFEVVRDGTRLAAGHGMRFVVLDRVPMVDDGFDLSTGVRHEASDEPAPERQREGDGSTPTDVTGDGVPEAIVFEWSGGAHCCFTLHICQFAPQFHMQRIELKHSDRGIFVQADDDPALEIRMHDWTFAYWNCSFADSPAPEICLKHDGWDWKPCAALMRREVPDLPSAENLADNWRQWDRFASGADATRVAVPWTPLLELIYGGNAEKAWKLLDAAWPGSAQDRVDFRRRLVQQLRTSPAWSALHEMNGSALDG